MRKLFHISTVLLWALMAFPLQASDCSPQLAKLNALSSKQGDVPDKEIIEVYERLLDLAEVKTLQSVQVELEGGRLNTRNITKQLSPELRDAVVKTLNEVKKRREKKEHIELLKRAMSKVLEKKTSVVSNRKKARKKLVRVKDLVPFRKKYENEVYAVTFGPYPGSVIIAYKGDEDETKFVVQSLSGKKRAIVLKGIRSFEVTGMNYLEGTGELIISDEEIFYRYEQTGSHAWEESKQHHHPDMARDDWGHYGLDSDHFIPLWPVKIAESGKEFTAFAGPKKAKGENEIGILTQVDLFNLESDGPLRNFWVNDGTYTRGAERFENLNLWDADVLEEGWRALTTYKNFAVGGRFLYMWDGNPLSEKPIATYFVKGGPSGEILGAHLHGKSRKVFLAGENGDNYVVNLPQEATDGREVEAPVRVMPELDYLPDESAMSPDGKYVGIIDKEAKLHIFDIESGTEVFKKKLETDFKREEGEPVSIVFSADNNYAAVILAKGVQVIDLKAAVEAEQK